MLNYRIQHLIITNYIFFVYITTYKIQKMQKAEILWDNIWSTNIRIYLIGISDKLNRDLINLFRCQSCSLGNDIDSNTKFLQVTSIIQISFFRSFL